MKRLSLYLFLILFTLQTPSQADDIRDFEIEGMSVGDSALDYFSEEEIMSHKMDWFNSDKFSVAADLQSSSFETYESIQIAFKTKDSKMSLETIEGVIFYPNNIKNCKKKLDKITTELSEMFTNTEKRNKKTFPHNADKSGKSLVTDVMFTFNSGDVIMIGCVDWSKEQKWSDHLRITIRTIEYNNFLGHAYK